MKKKIIIILAVLLLIGGGVYYFTSGKKNNPGNSATTAKAVIMDLEEAITATGRIEALASVDVKSEVSGKILSVRVKENDRVEKGDMIAEIDATGARLSFKEAEANYLTAKESLERQKKLFAEAFITKSQIEQTQAQFDISEARYMNARDQYEKTTVFAPVSGVVVKKYVESGNVITSGVSSLSAGTNLVTIADLSRKFVRAKLDEVDIGKIRKEQAAEITCDAFRGVVFQGKIIDVAPMAAIEQNLAFFDVLVEVFDRKNLLKINMSADVKILISRAEDAVCVPLEALKGRKDDYFLRVKENKRFKKVSVKTGLENDTYIQIVEGIEEDDEVMLKEARAEEKKQGGLPFAGGGMPRTGGGRPH